MKPTEIFGLIVRTAGLIIALWALYYVFLGVVELSRGHYTRMLLVYIPISCMGLWLLRYADKVVSFAYPPEQVKTKPIDIATGIICLAQIIGLLLLLSGPSLLGAAIMFFSGSAAIINYFLPPRHSEASQMKLKITSAVFGIVLMVFAVLTFA